MGMLYLLVKLGGRNINQLSFDHLSLMKRSVSSLNFDQLEGGILSALYRYLRYLVFLELAHVYIGF
jgi:hypothetical protein